MNRVMQLLTASATFAALVPGSALATENRAVQVDIFGEGPRVDAEAYKQVRRVFGEGVASGALDKFVVYEYGAEGGFSACAELSSFASSAEMRDVLDRLNRIKPNTRTTTYSVKPMAACK